MFQSTSKAKKGLPAGLAAAALIAGAALSYGVAAEPAYTIGARETVLGDGAGGLNQFPETPMAFLKNQPGDIQVLIGTSLRTAYCAGPTMKALTAQAWAVQPLSTGGKGYDQVSTHISSAWKDPKSTDIYACFNANDSDDVKRIAGPGIGFRGRYFSAGLAKSTDGGKHFAKLGQFLSIPKNATANDLQGDAFAMVVPEPTGKYLYAYYGDMYNAQLRHGVQTCMARAPIETNGMPGTWKKWYAGDFVTPGNSVIDTITYTGAETDPVVSFPGLDSGFNGDGMYPHVSYSAKAQAFIMVYAVNFFDEIPPADSLGMFPPVDRSGIWISFSQDGIHWTGQHQLVKAISIDYPGREVALHPTLVVDEAATTPNSIKATLYYGYNANMWLGKPATQYLVSHSISIVGGIDFSAAVRAPQTLRPNVGFSVLPGAAGQWLMSFSKGDVKGLRILGANGASAGKTLRVGEGRYQLEATRSAGPLFLQGSQNGASFSRILNLP
jgi:hypothetical protein